VIGIIGAKTKKALILEPQMRLACNMLLIATNDGSFERRGLATDVLENFLNQNKVDLVYAIGTVDMMRMVCAMTVKRGIETLVRLNPVMVDCMGMCGSCRVKVGGEMVLACVEGPEFDGHKVDFNDLEVRMNAYEEPKEWANQRSKPRPQGNAPGTLAKFLSGIRKS
jgi:ferredoxin--NADP+ reductase